MPQYPAIVELSSLDGADGFQMTGVSTFDRTGFSVSSAGDVNNDGFDDVIVGAFRANPSESGASYVVFGKAAGFGLNLLLSSLDGTNGFTIAGATANDQSGFSVSSAGDMNGDGFDDIIVGARYADPNGDLSGASYVVFGKAAGFTNLSLFGLDGSNGFRLSGAAAGDTSGHSVSAAGDINNDGFGDLIVGASFADPNGSASGAAYVVFGKAAGFAASLSLSALTGANGFKMSGVEPGDQAGDSVASAGDVNGDGFDDIVVGAYHANPNGNDTGASYVVFGGNAAFPANLNLSTLDGDNGFRVAGEVIGDDSGLSVTSAGDVNADGFGDLAIGAPLADPNGTASGAAYVVFGKAAGFAASLNLSTLDGAGGFQLSGAAGDNAGVSVSSAGDFNGDGFADIIVGSDGASPNGSDSGQSCVLFGKASGFDANLNLSSLDGANGFVLNGEGADDYSGVSVSSAGDVNGDGFDDLIVGAPRNFDNRGLAYVIFGGPPGEDVARTGTGIANTIHGGDFDDTLSGLGGDDALIADDGDDAVYGGSGNDAIDTATGDDFIKGGSGDDAVHAGAGADEVHGGSGADALSGDMNGDFLDGGSGNDVLLGGLGGDRLIGGDGKDTLDGGDDQDVFVYRLASESTSSGFDVVKNADFAIDLWDVSGHITDVDATVAHGNLTTTNFDTKLAAAIDAAHLGAHHAVVFTPTSGNLSGKIFLVVDLNGVAGYQSGADLVAQLTTPANLANFDPGDFI